MRTPALLVLGALAAGLGSGCATTVTYRDTTPDYGEEVSVETFDDALSPWGEWLYVDGVRVWRPYQTVVGPEFSPYATHGRWVHADYGWSFESEFEWGWAPFHYGRWMHVHGPGWVWVPGTRWAPAWVTWRTGGGYIGWAPLAPDWVRVESPWVFVETRHFVVGNVYRYRVPRTRVGFVWRSTVPMHSRYHGSMHVAPRPPHGQPARPVHGASRAQPISRAPYGEVPSTRPVKRPPGPQLQQPHGQPMRGVPRNAPGARPPPPGRPGR